MCLVHFPSFVGCGGETAGEEDFFLLAQSPDVLELFEQSRLFFFMRCGKNIRTTPLSKEKIPGGSHSHF